MPIQHVPPAGPNHKALANAFNVINENFGSVAPPTTGNVVSVGSDFGTFHEAMVWAINQPAGSGEGETVIVLPDGIHLIGEPDTLSDAFWAYYVIQNMRLTIVSEAQNKANCTIAMSPTDDGENWPTQFSLLEGAALIMTAITLDPDAAGYPYSQSTIGIESNFARIDLGLNTFKNMDSAIAARNGSIITDTSTAFTDNYTGITANSGSKAILTTPTFSGNSADTDTPLNEVQYDGSYISDKTAALSFKA